MTVPFKVGGRANIKNIVKKFTANPLPLDAVPGNLQSGSARLRTMQLTPFPPNVEERRHILQRYHDHPEFAILTNYILRLRQATHDLSVGPELAQLWPYWFLASINAGLRV